MWRKKYRKTFILADLFASAMAWSSFFIYRKVFIESLKFGIPVPFQPDLKFFAGLVLVPAFWFLLYYATGTYQDLRRKTHSKNLGQLFITTLAGVGILFFLLILDDTVISYRNYYESVIVLFLLQYFCVLILRVILLSHKNLKFHHGKDEFKVVMLGTSGRIIRFCSENHLWLKKNHFTVVGYLLQDMHEGTAIKFSSPVTGVEDAGKLVRETKAEEVFIIMDPPCREVMENLLYLLFRHDVYIRILPELYPVTSLPVKVVDLFHAPLWLLSDNVLAMWQQSIKTFLDILLSIIAIVLLSPVIVVLIILIKATSTGPVLYSHTRIGKNGLPFRILKFRSMYMNSEPDGPRLAVRNDPRITPVGKFMRRRRLDEIPNFINVFKGDMSLVGPRPERAFYIEQIIGKAPQYSKLHLVKPGITSWGQVKYGYAENIGEMMQRMRYDQVYIENMSLFVDFQILFKTVGIVLRGKGM